MKENIEFLKQLVETPSPTGYENGIVPVVKNYMDEFSNFCYVDNFQNVIAEIVPPDEKTTKKEILISAHHDELGFLVSQITEAGGIKFTRSSGEDKRTLIGSKLLVMDDEDRLIEGIVVHKPIHVIEDDEWRKPVDVDSLVLDIGCTSKDEVLDMGIHPGSHIIYPKGEEKLEFGNQGKLIVSNSLDDKIGVYIVSEVARRVNSLEKFKKSKTVLYAASISGEESGLRGAGVVAQKFDPDVSIDIDVTPSTESDLGISKAKYGDIELGKGVVIEFGPAKSDRIAKEMVKIAKENNIKFQYGISRAGGTNTSVIQERARDCETMLLSIPNKNMHQQNEICHWDDVQACIDLLVAWLDKVGIHA